MEREGAAFVRLFIPKPQRPAALPGRASRFGRAVVQVVPVFQPVVFEEPPDEEQGDDEGEHVRQREGGPDAVLSPEPGQHQQERQQEEHLARQGKEDGQTGLPDGLEEVADDDLAADEREGQHADGEAVGRQADERGVIREEPGNAAGEENAGQEAQRGEGSARQHAVLEGEQDAPRLHGPVVVADDGLHALREADDEHGEQDENAVDDAVSADSQVPPVVRKLPVDGDGDRAAAYVYQARSHADGQDAGDDGLAQFPDAAAEVDRAGRVREVEQHARHAGDLGQQGGQGCPGDAPFEPEDEDGSQDDVDPHGEQGGAHGLFRVAGGPHHVVEVEKDVRDGQPQQGDEHEVVRVGEGLPAGAEGGQDFRQEEQCGNHQHHGGDQAHDEDVPQRALRPLLVLLAQTDGADGRPADAHQRAQRKGQVHDGEGDGQAGQGQGAHAVADEDAVNDVVQGVHHHAGDGGQGVLDQQTPYGCVFQFCDVA